MIGIQVKLTEFSDLITRYTADFDILEMRRGTAHGANVGGGNHELHQLWL